MFDQTFSDTGGGWTESPAGDAKTGGSRRGRENAPTIPVSCEMLRGVLPGEEKVTIGSHEFNSVTLVGRIVNIDRPPSAASIDYVITDDDQNQTIIRQYTTDETGLGDFQVDNWVRVYGRIRNFGGTLSIVAYKILASANPKDAEAHQLEVKLCVVLYEKDIINRIRSRTITLAGLENTMCGPLKSGAQRNAAAATSAGAAANSSQAAGTITVGGLTGINAQVMLKVTALGKGADEKGASMQQICSSLPNMKREIITQAIEFLCSEGHIYSTVDDEHFAAI